MSWTRLDDLWCEKQDLAVLPHADRWHYLCMIQFASRANLRDGILRAVDARRCSDHPDPQRALSSLVEVGLVETDSGETFRIVQIKDHLPSEASLRRTEQNRERQRRRRMHEAGDHSLCLPTRPCRQDMGDAPTHVTGDAQETITRYQTTHVVRDNHGAASLTSATKLVDLEAMARVEAQTGDVYWRTRLPGQPDESKIERLQPALVG